MRRRVKITIEYDGTDFHGWQHQPNLRTVQGEIEAALSKILEIHSRVVGAGRTDSGVHATGQVAHFDLSNSIILCDQLLKGINSRLPEDVKLMSVENVSEQFHARFSAVSRRYNYRLESRFRPLRSRYSWHPKCSWDNSLVQRGAALLEGRHCFKSFAITRPDEESYSCQVFHAVWQPDDDGATFDILADRFLHKMVRGLVGALIDLGRGYLSLEQFSKLLNSPQRTGDVIVAPPQGLTLIEVGY